MKWYVVVCVVLLMSCVTCFAGAEEMQGPLSFKVKSIQGDEVDLSKYQGKVVLIVNVASLCGNTPQYKTLQAMYEKYHDQGLEILGFPANEFGHQEPGTDSQILEFCTSKYQVTFPMFSKVVVKGEGICPLYQNLTGKETNSIAPGEVTWNFEKFLVGRDGKISKRFSPKTKPDTTDVVSAVEAELAKK
jgi:glutathione peroxidase